MKRQWLECLVCAARYSFGPMWRGCPECAMAAKGAPLEVRYDYGSIKDFSCDSIAPGIWRWHQLLPSISAGSRVSLHEGATPLCRIECGQNGLWLKNESVNPTWSYKDRANTVNITLAKRARVQESSGNQYRQSWQLYGRICQRRKYGVARAIVSALANSGF